MSQNNISELGRPLCFPVDIFCRWCKLNFGSQHGSSELSYKTFKVYFRCCLIFFPTTTSSQLKNNNFQSQNLNHRDLFPYLNHILRSKFELLVKLNISQIPQKSIRWSTYFKKLVTLHTVNSLTVNSCHKYFSANITRFSEQLPLKPSSFCR